MRVAKTNTGVDFFKNIEHKNQGSPDLRSKRSELGTIKDIKFPDTEKGRNGLQIIIAFDNQKLGTPLFWFSLAEDAGMILSSVGNREAVLLAPPRVSYTYHPTSFYQGIAKIVCDNSYGTYTKYQNNQSNNVVAPVAALASGGSPPGKKVTPPPANPSSVSFSSTNINKTTQLPEKMTPEQWQEYQIKEIQNLEARGLAGEAVAGSMIGRTNITILRDYSVYEEIWARHLRGGQYDEAIRLAAKEAASQAPAAIGSEEGISIESEATQSIPVTTEAEYARKLKGL
jgi:hypothetical protein